ncbi:GLYCEROPHOSPHORYL DIESTER PHOSPHODIESTERASE (GLYCEROPHOSPHODIESTER PHOSPHODIESTERASE) [Mycoplasmopsis pulmonis]|uniref:GLYCEROPHOSPHORYL DIESTER PHOSPHODIESTERASE (GLYCEROPHOSPHODIESTER PHOSPHODIESTERASE) n=1 Tax=Mycoplasmopsis pulmonis (strain UAB CTIP) TaxID=272635 RepID=Q98QU8_MYCPU|nr:glycerophosphodiester phosphodiesterase [Mycoplasmopsis pulmonis]CAC13436.1 GLYCEROPHOSPHORYL DIESTER PHOSPHODIESTERASE (GLYCEROPHOSPHODIESTER PHOSPHODIESTERASE) [Mycoplasmopsis pulmonis]VEU68024.1 glycerophosphodiester phosphodiesterase family protein [Mycoplasmopsis pulmonis]
MSRKQLLLAHRGYMAIAPENTPLSFELAKLFGFDGVELDVHLTKDQKLVIIHDESTNRTALNDKVIANETLNSLKKDDHGLFFKVKVPRQTILTLEEFLDKYLDVFEIINVEIKSDVYHYPNIENKIFELSLKYGQKLIDKVIFSSFNFETLKIMKKLNPNFKLAFLFWTKTQLEKVSKNQIFEVCDFLNPWTELYEKIKDELDKFNLPYLLWTIRSNDKYQKFLKDKKVYAQISNYKWK